MKIRLQTKQKLFILLNILFFTFVSLTFTASAAPTDVTFTPLVGIPGLENDEDRTIPGYINKLYIVIISLGALFAVLRIAFAGVKYSLDEIVTHKEDAKNDIKGVLLGLGILLIPFIVLSTIYPNLTNLDFLKNLRENPLSSSEVGSRPVASVDPDIAPPGAVDMLICTDSLEECERRCVASMPSGYTAEAFRRADNTTRCRYTPASPSTPTPAPERTPAPEPRPEGAPAPREYDAAHPRSGTRTITIFSATDYPSVRDLVRRQEICTRESGRGGGLTDGLACVKRIPITCPEGAYFDSVTNNCLDL